MNFQFIDYIPVQNEKHMGIAVVKAFNAIVLRYKIIMRKDGKGFFPGAPCYKIGDSWIPALDIDSKQLSDEVAGLIRSEVDKRLKGQKVPHKIYSEESHDGLPF